MVELAAGSVVRIGDAAARAWPDDTTSAAELGVAAERAQQMSFGSSSASARARLSQSLGR